MPPIIRQKKGTTLMKMKYTNETPVRWHLSHSVFDALILNERMSILWLLNDESHSSFS